MSFRLAPPRSPLVDARRRLGGNPPAISESPGAGCNVGDGDRIAFWMAGVPRETDLAFLFATNESLSAGTVRIVLEQADDAITHLTYMPEGHHAAVHEARKAFKRIRALLRLSRARLGADAYRTENRFYRDAGRRLAPYRERFVLAQTTDRLAERAGDLRRAALLAELADALRTETRQAPGATTRVQRPPADLEGAAVEVARALRVARVRVPGWPARSDPVEAVSSGVRRTYRDGRRRLGDVREGPSVRRLHEWRKQVKYLWYQMRLLRSGLPEALGGIVTELDELAELLGTDHDLAVLRRTLKRRPELATGEPRHSLFALIAARREELQAAALPIGERLYREPPRVFSRRIDACLEVWRAVPLGAQDRRPPMNLAGAGETGEVGIAGAGEAAS